MEHIRQEPSWEKLLWGSPPQMVHTRPALGSESLIDQFSILFDGFAEFSLGFALRTSYSSSELLSRTKDAMARLRFFCPIVGTALEAGIHDPQLRSWVYVPIKDAADLQEWLDQTVVMLDEPMDPDAFGLFLSQTCLPYVLSNGWRQQFRCYIYKPVEDPEAFAIQFHGSHAFMDARPAWNAFSLLFQWIVNPEPTASLKWGTEFENLPVGPLTATGGPRDDWDVGGQTLMGCAVKLLMDPTPSHGLQLQHKTAIEKGKPIRVRATLSELETARMMSSLKKWGLSPTQLLDAATAMAIFKLNPNLEVEPSKAHITYPVSMISLARHFESSINPRTQFISSLALMPFRLNWTDISDIQDEKDRLHTAMKKYKTQYSDYLGNPHLPHITAVQARIAPPREVPPTDKPGAISPTNMGMVEQFVPTQWFSRDAADGKPVLSLQELCFGHRLSDGHLFVHGWSINSRFSIQLQASDTYDPEYVESFLKEIVRQFMLVVD